jgi:hypothetical protein
MSFKTLEQQVVGLTNKVLGRDVTYTPSGGSDVSIKGVFDNTWVDVEGVVSLKPILRIDLSDLEALPAKGDTVSIETVNYRVSESRLDGYGGSTLILKKV